MSEGLERLILGVQDYNWGKVGASSEVCKLLVSSGQWKDGEVDQGKSYAELWVGTHTKTPSRMENGGGLLSNYIQTQPALLGKPLLAQFGPCLPFLTKVLSIGHPLQLQVHPDMATAKNLHRKNPSAFLDANHKPEMAVALTPFTALCGWREPVDILRMANCFPEFGAALGSQAVSILASSCSDEEKVAACYKAIFTNQPGDMPTSCQVTSPSHLSKLEARLKQSCLKEGECAGKRGEEGDEEWAGKRGEGEEEEGGKEEASVFLQLSSAFPEDKGCWAVFLLQLHRLEPGEAIWVPAGQIHAYVSGDCVEVLSCGDNVLFCGLVHQEDSAHFPPELMDPALLAQVVSFKPSPSPRVKEMEDYEGLPTLSPPVKEFKLAKIQVEGGKDKVVEPISTASTLLVIQGSGFVSSSSSSRERFSAGQAFFLPCENHLNISASSATLIYRVTIADQMSE